MKKLVCFIVCMVMILSAAVCAFADASGSWPVKVINGTGSLTRPSNRDPEFWVQAFYGPNKSYATAGAYKVKKIVKMQALFCDGGFVYVDVQYKTLGRRCVYFQKGMMWNSSVEDLGLTGVPAKTTETIVPQLGPGVSYAQFKEGAIGSGTPVQVFFETDDGWLFAEFDCSLGKVRAWLPANQVKAD